MAVDDSTITEGGDDLPFKPADVKVGDQSATRKLSADFDLSQSEEGVEKSEEDGSAIDEFLPSADDETPRQGEVTSSVEYV